MEQMNKKQKRQAAKAAKAVKQAPAATAAVDSTEVTPKVAKVVKAAKEALKSGLPPLPKMPSANRTRKPRPTQPCVCGCGQQTHGVWAPGHDARAKGYKLRIERGIMKMSDVPANEQAGVKFVMKLAKELGTPQTAATGGIKLVKKAKAKAVTAETEQPVTETAATGTEGGN